MTPLLRGFLYRLPEPILLCPHANPDGDAMSSAVALLETLREAGVECGITVRGVLRPDVAWMLDPDDIADEVLVEEAQSAICVDCRADRTGLDLSHVFALASIDHHPNHSFDEMIGDPEFAEKALVNRHSRAQGTKCAPVYFIREGNESCFYAPEAISTASILARELNPAPLILAAGIYSDTNGYRVRTREAIHDTDQLVLRSEYSTLEGQQIIDRDIIPNMSVKGGLRDLMDILDSDLTFYEVEKEDGGILQVMIVELNEIARYDITTRMFLEFADVLALVNKSIPGVSLRSSSKDFPVRQIAERFGGGGHAQASGYRLKPEISIVGQVKALKDELIRGLNIIETWRVAG